MLRRRWGQISSNFNVRGLTRAGSARVAGVLHATSVGLGGLGGLLYERGDSPAEYSTDPGKTLLQK